MMRCSAEFSPVKEMRAEEYRRVTEVTYLGYVHGTPRRVSADGSARPRRHRAGRVGPRLSLDPPPVGVLRGEARDRRIHRFPSVRAHPRRQSCQAHDGQHAGAEHAPVRLGAQPAAVARASLSRRSSSPRSQRGRSCTRPSTRVASSRSDARHTSRCGARSWLPGCWTGTSGRPDTRRSRRPNRKRPTDLTISRLPLTPPSTTARTAASTDGLKAGARRSSWRSIAESRSRPPRWLDQWRRSRREDRSETRRVVALEDSPAAGSWVARDRWSGILVVADRVAPVRLGAVVGQLRRR